MRFLSNLFTLLRSVLAMASIKGLFDWIGNITLRKRPASKTLPPSGQWKLPRPTESKTSNRSGPTGSPDATHAPIESERGHGQAPAEVLLDKTPQSQAPQRPQQPQQLQEQQQQRQGQQQQRQQNAEPGSDEQSRLEFVLEGSDARGLTILAGGKANLAFRQAAAEKASGGIVEGKKLEELFEGKQSLDITVTPDDGLTINGRRSVTAHFEDGVLIESVSFPVAAVDKFSGDTGVHIELHRGGATLYEFKLPVNVLPVGDALPDRTEPVVLDLDAMSALSSVAAVAPPKRRISLKVRFESGLLYVDMEDYVDGEFNYSIQGPAPSFDPARLARLLDKVNQSLGSDFYDASAWSIFDGEETTLPGTVRMLAAASERIAEAGSLLYEELAADATLKQILTYIDQAAPGTRITIKTVDVYLPWELLYPFRFSTTFDEEDRTRWPLRTDAIWGARFAIETMQLGEGNYAALQRTRRHAEPRASINLNPTIRIEGAPNPDLPRALHTRLAASLADNGHIANVHDTCKDIRAVLQKAIGTATLIYVFCHGSAPPALSGQGSEELLLDTDCSLKPRDIDDERPFASGPIIFLNACHSGAFSPLSFVNFLRSFRKKSSLGLIATNFTVPTAFAARFGAEVVSAYFSVHGMSVADLLLDLRRRHLRNGNPVPLFYAVQCQVELN